MTHSPQQFLAALDDRARRVYRQMVKAGYNGMEARQAAADDFRIRSKYNGKRAGAQASRQAVRCLTRYCQVKPGKANTSIMQAVMA